jgi:hypothetical protein
MADRAKKISEVPAVTSVVSTDLFVVVANAAGNAVTSRITLGSLANTLGISNTSSANLTYSINKITTSTLSVGNSTINTAINATVVTSSARLAIGNTTVTGFINTSTYGTFGGTVNAASLNISGLTSISNTGLITAPQVGNIIPFYHANQAAFPSAASSHGALAHSHSDGKMYFAHSGSWNAIVSDGAVGNVSGLNISGNLTVSGNVAGNTEGFEIGFRDRPQILLTANTTIANTARTKHFYQTSSSNVVLTIANNATIPMPVGTTMTIVTSNNFVNVVRGDGVDMVTSNNQTSADRTISPSNIIGLLKIDTNKWFISGAGLT